MIQYVQGLATLGVVSNEALDAVEKVLREDANARARIPLYYYKERFRIDAVFVLSSESRQLPTITNFVRRIFAETSYFKIGMSKLRP
jgi:hypothetical protein